MRLHTIGKISGFTLLEILIVLILVSIFVTLAVVQHSTSDATLVAQCEVLKSHLRYAQTRSIDTDVHWGIYYHYSSVDPTDCSTCFSTEATSPASGNCPARPVTGSTWAKRPLPSPLRPVRILQRRRPSR